MTVDDRLRDVEIKLHGVVQRVTEHEEDFRRFGPLITEQALTRAAIERMEREFGKDLQQAHEAIRDLGRRLDTERGERIEGQAKRKEELEAAVAEREKQHRDLRLKYVQVMVGLMGIFITSLGGIVVAYLAWKAGSGG